MDKLKEASETVAQQSMDVGAAETKQFYEAEEDEIFDVALSGDGTWRKRGFKSTVGVVTVISLLSGKNFGHRNNVERVAYMPHKYEERGHPRI